MSLLIKGALENIEILRNKEDGLSGIPSGFTNLDRVTSGWQNSDLIIIAPDLVWEKLHWHLPWQET